MEKRLAFIFVAMHFVLPIVLIGWPGTAAATIAKWVWIVMYLPVFAAMLYLLYCTAEILGIAWKAALTGRTFPDPRDNAAAWISLTTAVILLAFVVLMIWPA